MAYLKSKVFLKFFFLFGLIFLSNNSEAAPNPPFELPPQAELLKLKTAIIYTSVGNIYLDLHPEDAPWHVANFKFRADRGLYKGTIFNIFEPNFLIQGGERTEKSAKPPYFLPPEFTGFKHEEGAVGMARPPDESNPERLSHPRQFYICTNRAPHMDGRYTIFGHVREGMDVVEKLRKGDEIIDVKVFVRPNP
jgi:cyclophilin family peptidyl-prolyl cis-trans isomerase